MFITDLSIKRPVVSTVFSLILMIFASLNLLDSLYLANTLLPILYLGLFGNRFHSDFEMARLLNESKEDIKKARGTGLKKLKQKIY